MFNHLHPINIPRETVQKEYFSKTLNTQSHHAPNKAGNCSEKSGYRGKGKGNQATIVPLQALVLLTVMFRIISLANSPARV